MTPGQVVGAANGECGVDLFKMKKKKIVTLWKMSKNNDYFENVDFCENDDL